MMLEAEAAYRVVRIRSPLSRVASPHLAAAMSCVPGDLVLRGPRWRQWWWRTPFATSALRGHRGPCPPAEQASLPDRRLLPRERERGQSRALAWVQELGHRRGRQTPGSHAATAQQPQLLTDQVSIWRPSGYQRRPRVNCFSSTGGRRADGSGPRSASCCLLARERGRGDPNSDGLMVSCCPMRPTTQPYVGPSLTRTRSERRRRANECICSKQRSHWVDV
jgi:hypothetical protein